MELKGNVLVAQGGGPTAVINQSLVGIIQEAKKYSNVKKIYGALNGVNGIINEKLLDLNQESDINLEKIAKSPAAALLSTRDKPDKEYCNKIFNVLKKYEIKYFLYIGGNDSSDTVRIVNEYAQSENYNFRAVHVPKTIDNDLVLNDHTPGFGSAAKFVSEAFKGVNLDNKALGGVYIGVVMGRHAGFLTAASALGRKYPEDGPHLIYLPESTFDLDNFVKDVKEKYKEYGRCIIAVSEGIQDDEGNAIITTLMEDVEKDAHGNVQLSGTGALGDLLVEHLKKNTDIGRVRADTFGYLQRSFAGCVSEVDQLEAREAGIKAVQFAVINQKSGSVAIKRVGDYAIDFKLEKLEDIGGKTKYMPEEFINTDGNFITDKFIKYGKPLIGKNCWEVEKFKAPRIK